MSLTNFKRKSSRQKPVMAAMVVALLAAAVVAAGDDASNHSSVVYYFGQIERPLRSYYQAIEMTGQCIEQSSNRCGASDEAADSQRKVVELLQLISLANFASM